MPQTFHLALLIHAHQPCGNFEHVLEKAYDDSYLPFLECLEEHPDVRLGLHYSGPLLTWIEKHRPEYFDRLRKLVQSGQVELVGGGFYEPILVSIPPEDQLEQITRLACYLEKHFGPRPTGAWLAERVWEPQLPSVLAEAKEIGRASCRERVWISGRAAPLQKARNCRGGGGRCARRYTATARTVS